MSKLWVSIAGVAGSLVTIVAVVFVTLFFVGPSHQVAPPAPPPVVINMPPINNGDNAGRTSTETNTIVQEHHENTEVTQQQQTVTVTPPPVVAQPPKVIHDKVYVPQYVPVPVPETPAPVQPSFDGLSMTCPGFVMNFTGHRLFSVGENDGPVREYSITKVEHHSDGVTVRANTRWGHVAAFYAQSLSAQTRVFWTSDKGVVVQDCTQ